MSQVDEVTPGVRMLLDALASVRCGRCDGLMAVHKLAGASFCWTCFRIKARGDA